MPDAPAGYSPVEADTATNSFSGWEPKKLWRSEADGGRSEECAWTEGFDRRAEGRRHGAKAITGHGRRDPCGAQHTRPATPPLRNDGEVGHAVTLRFEPASGVRDAANVKVRLEGRAEEVLLHRGFASSVPPELTRGLGERSSAQVEVTWRSGQTQRFEVKAGHVTTLVEKTGAARASPFAASEPRPPARFPSTLGALGLAPTGKQTLVTLFLAGCAPCRKEAPTLNALAAGGTRVIGLGVAASDEAAVPIARALGFTFEARALPAWAAEALSTNGQLDFPTTLVFAADGALERVVSDVSSLR